MYCHNIPVVGHLDHLGKVTAIGILEIHYFGHTAGTAVGMAGLVAAEHSGLQGTDDHHMGLFVVVDCKEHIVKAVVDKDWVAVGHMRIHLR